MIVTIGREAVLLEEFKFRPTGTHWTEFTRKEYMNIFECKKRKVIYLILLQFLQNC